MNAENPEGFDDLLGAALFVDQKQGTRTSSGWYFALAFAACILGLVRAPSAVGRCFFACGLGLTVAALLGLVVSDAKLVLWSRISVAGLAAIVSLLYCGFHALDAAGFVLAVFLGKMIILDLTILRTLKSVEAVPPDPIARAQRVFSIATKSNPDETPNLVALSRAGGLKLLLPDENVQFEYRLVFDRDVIFLVGMDRLFGVRYGPRFRLIVPSRTFHINPVGETFRGKRSKVNLMLGGDPAFQTLEITPEMLLKARQQIASIPNSVSS